MTKPCIHGDLCRAYLRRFGNVNSHPFEPRIPCIYDQRCPECCHYYEPISDERETIINLKKDLDVWKRIAREAYARIHDLSNL